jgi:DNA-binding MarR family transcriptional regulator
MSGTVADLEEAGLVARTPDASDARRRLIALTPGGRQVLRDRRSARSERLADVLASDFTESERQQLAAAGPLLERVARKISGGDV